MSDHPTARSQAGPDIRFDNESRLHSLLGQETCQSQSETLDVLTRDDNSWRCFQKEIRLVETPLVFYLRSAWQTGCSCWCSWLQRRWPPSRAPADTPDRSAGKESWCPASPSRCGNLWSQPSRKIHYIFHQSTERQNHLHEFCLHKFVSLTRWVFLVHSFYVTFSSRQLWKSPFMLLMATLSWGLFGPLT